MALENAIAKAWSAYDNAAGLECRVVPAAPILFFGDLDEYQASPLRIVTVGLNPSLEEFPDTDPFRRFPMAADRLGREPALYLRAMSAYFDTAPYSNWFNAFEPLLNGMEASYYRNALSTALHTDICSPVATNPTWADPKWAKLSDDPREILAKDGVPLWHMLLETLKPQIVLLSVAKTYLRYICFPVLSDWKIIHTFRKKKNGAERPKPYNVNAIWYDVAGEESLFAFGRANRKPFMNIDNNRKRKAGALIAKAYRNGR